jgi:molybdate transport system permease protein
MDVWHLTWFTLATAGLATLLMLGPGLFVAWLLARGRFRGRVLLETVVTLPLVMPPVAIGLVLLMVFSPIGSLGRLLARAEMEIVFTWKAVVIAMAVMGFPLLVRTAKAGIEQVDRRYEAAASTLGAGPLRVFFTITLPLARPAIIAGAVLGFARALGEFGATVMVAGSIPGATRTLAVGIFSAAEMGHDREALVLAGISGAIAFVALWLSNWLSSRAGVRA